MSCGLEMSSWTSCIKLLLEMEVFRRPPSADGLWCFPYQLSQLILRRISEDLLNFWLRHFATRPAGHMVSLIFLCVHIFSHEYIGNNNKN